jgi:hypothetical protein
MVRGAFIAGVGVAAAIVVAWGGAGSASAGDVDCSDFGSQAAAQRFFLSHGGPGSDPHNLDADGDGKACESNPCPCAGGGKPGGGKPKPKPKKRKPIERPVRAGTTFVPSACINKAVMPPSIILSCGDAQLRLEQLTWSSWERLIANGQGALTYPNCLPPTPVSDCNTREAVPAAVQLFRPRYCANVKHNSFTRAHVEAPTALFEPSRSFTQPFPCKLLRK